jgi:hypothetical protein
MRIRKPFTALEIEYVQKHYPEKKMKDICEDLNCKPSRIYTLAKKLGVKRDPEFLKRQLHEAGKVLSTDQASVNNRFTPGQVSHNKGKKGVYFRGAEKGWFRKGEPINLAEVGDITIRKNSRGHNYKWICVGYNKWEQYHRHLWIQHKGPIPKDHIIRFKNGDSMDVQISNLECISKRENVMRNQDHRKSVKSNRLVKMGEKTPQKISPYKAALRLTKGDKALAREIADNHPRLAELAQLNITLNNEIRKNGNH